MLQTRKTIEITFGFQNVNRKFSFRCHLKKNKISELKKDISLYSPGLSGRQVTLYQIARYDE